MPKNKRMNLTPRGQGEDALYSPVTTETKPQGEKVTTRRGVKVYFDEEHVAWLEDEGIRRRRSGRPFDEYSLSAIVREAIDRLREAEE